MDIVEQNSDINSRTQFAKKCDIISNYQIIRGVGCILVALNHCSFFNKHGLGKCGVEFFIIISGLLTALNANRTKKLSSNYLLRKVIKILPLYWVLTIVIFEFGLVAPQLFSSLTFNFMNLLYSLLLIPGHELFLFPGWTLTFFFVFYVIYYISDKISSQYRDVIACFLVTSYVIAGRGLEIVYPKNLISQYFNPILLEFVYGVILFHVTKKISLPTNSIIAFIITLVVIFVDCQVKLTHFYT